MTLASFLFKNLLKDAATNSLKSPQVYTLNYRPFSTKVRSEILERQQQESIFSLFKAYGITGTLISSFISKNPVLVSLHPQKIIKPKLEFLTSVGFSPTDLDQLLSADPFVLNRSLDNQIIPSYQFLKGVLKDNASVIAAIKRSTWVLKQDLNKNMAANIAVLQDYGVPHFGVSTCLRTQPRTLMHSPDRFKELVEEIKEMGFDPKKGTFLVAVQLIGMNKLTWNQKWDLYRKWGWSENEILSAFRRKPMFMAVSKEKLERVMDFLVNKMGWDVSEIAGCPGVFLHCLENWTIPRCLVVQFLLSKGVIKKDFSLTVVIVPTEKQFLIRFVDQYRERFPEVLNLYGRPKDDISNIQVTRVSTVGEKII